MNKTLETVEAVHTHTHTHTTHFLRNKKGVSLIALVITIIVVIIMASIAFNNSTSTIGKADYSKFVTNISEVQEAIAQKVVTVRGEMVADGSQITDAQAYNYVAKGGKTDADVLPKGRVPDYTIVEKTADIGIKLPTMKVETKSKSKVEVTYAVTKEGKVFVWPPYEYENKYLINDTSEVAESSGEATGDIDVVVANLPITIAITSNGKLEGRELLEDGLTKKEFEEILSKIEVGNYVNYELTTEKKVSTLASKTGALSEMLTTVTNAKWRILSIDESTGRILITTEGPVNSVKLQGVKGYLYGADELHRLCEKLYSNTDKGLVARSMTIEDLNKACDYTPPTEDEQLRFAWYPADTPDDELKDVEAGGKVYTAKKHGAGVTKPRFYTWDDASGVTHTAENENDYKELKSANEPVLTSKTWYGYNPGAGNAVINSILGGNETNRGWLASLDVALYLQYERAYFELRHACSDVVGGSYLHNSTAVDTRTLAYGLRPVVQFSAKLLDISDTTKTGSESAPWEIK